MKILIDNGHGVDTAGKRSPDGRLREYAYTREIAERLELLLKIRGYDAERIVKEESDVPLRTRCRRANEICAKLGSQNVLLVSIHCDASGSDGKWHDPNGWSARVSLRNASSKSKKLATLLAEAAEGHGLRVRRPTPQQAYWMQDLAICRDTNCPAVLTENLFQDNHKDVEFLLSEDGRNTITCIHAAAIEEYIKRQKP